MADEDLPGAELVAVGAAGLKRQAGSTAGAGPRDTRERPVHNGRAAPAWWDQPGVSWCSSVASHQ
jgi:hypothetical protein